MGGSHAGPRARPVTTFSVRTVIGTGSVRYSTMKEAKGKTAGKQQSNVRYFSFFISPAHAKTASK